jgi:hypothetical protein
MLIAELSLPDLDEAGTTNVAVYGKEDLTID